MELDWPTNISPPTTMLQSLSYGLFGSFAALGAAALWAVTSILYQKLGNEVSPLALNFSKGIIGLIFLGITILLIDVRPINLQSFFYLGISALLGISLGDTLFFITLNHLGPRLTLLMGTLVQVFTVIMAVIFLNERPSFLNWIGIFFTLGGVTWVVMERLPSDKTGKIKFTGVIYGLLTMLCMSGGVIFAKIGVTSISALQATFIRLLCGVAGLIVWGTASRQIKVWAIPFKTTRLLTTISFVVLLGVLGSWLFLLSLKYLDASIANTLNATSPLFILPMAAFALKEKPTTCAVTGAIIAISGIIFICI